MEAVLIFAGSTVSAVAVCICGIAAWMRTPYWASGIMAYRFRAGSSMVSSCWPKSASAVKSLMPKRALLPLIRTVRSAIAAGKSLESER